VQQLLAYKQFKEAAAALDDRKTQWHARFAVKPHKDDEDAPPLELDLEDADVAALWEAFSDILDSIGAAAAHNVVYDDTPIALHAEDILDRIRRDGSMTLQSIFEGRTSRSELVGLFLATLELTRQRKIRVVQEQVGQPIQLELREPEDATAVARTEQDTAEWRDPHTGKIDYEWPSDQIRLQVEQRAKVRAERARSRDFEGSDEPVIDPDDGP